MVPISFEFFLSDKFLIGGETFQDLQDQYEEPIQFEAKKIDPEDEEEEEELEDAKYLSRYFTKN